MNEVKVRLIISEKSIIYVLSPEKETKKIPVIIKQIKNIINANNSFLQARVYYVRETCLQKQKR